MMKRIVSRPVTWVVIFCIAMLVGGFCAPQLKVDLYPSLSVPVVLVSTVLPGASPTIVEEEITKPVEKALQSISGIDHMTSVSGQSSSIVIVNFNYNENVNAALSRVRDKLDLISNFPDAAQKPIIGTFDPNEIPIMYYRLETDKPMNEVYNYFDQTIQPALQQAEGVAQVSLSGASKPIISVDVSQKILNSYHLSFYNLLNALSSNGVYNIGSYINAKSSSISVETTTEYSKISQIKDTAVPVGNGFVRLGNIAHIGWNIDTINHKSFFNGERSYSISITKESDANTVSTSDAVKAKIKELNKTFPSGTQLILTNDTTKQIRSSINTAWSSAIEGAILAILVLYLFLRSFKTTIIVGVAIPIAFLITLAGMYFVGYSLNLMTLTGLILGIGMLLDNSIVLIDKVYAYRELGVKPKIAAIIGSQEIMLPIVASTITSIVVYAPFILFKNLLGPFGSFFVPLAFTVVLSLVASLIVAIFLVPVLASHYLVANLDPSKKWKPFRWFDSVMRVALIKLDLAYAAGIRFVLKWRLYSLFVMLLILIISIIFISLPGFQLFVKVDPTKERVNVTFPADYSLDATSKALTTIANKMQKDFKGQVKDIVVQAGKNTFYGGLGATLYNEGSIRVDLLPGTSQKQGFALKQKMKTYFDNYAGVQIGFDNEGSFNNGSDIDIRVFTRSGIQTAQKVALEVQSLIEKHVPDVLSPTTSVDNPPKELNFVFDRKKAAVYGITAASFASQMEGYLNGSHSSQTTFKVGDSSYDIYIRLPENERENVSNYKNLYIIGKNNIQVPIYEVAHLKIQNTPTTINRYNQKEVVDVTGDVSVGHSTTAVMGQIKQAIKQYLVLPPGVTLQYGGSFADIIKYGLTFIYILLFALILVYCVLAAQFESFRGPFIIILNVPFLLIGVILVYLASHTPYTLLSAVGVMMLVGISVNTGIVFVDYANLLRGRGYSVYEALVATGRSRLRPILMSTVTTLLGMAPMAFSRGEGSEILAPIGLTVFGGLITNTVLTLFFIPVLYSYFFKDKPLLKPIKPKQLL